MREKGFSSSKAPKSNLGPTSLLPKGTGGPFIEEGLDKKKIGIKVYLVLTLRTSRTIPIIPHRHL
jgi:hypothetical protein